MRSPTLAGSGPDTARPVHAPTSPRLGSPPVRVVAGLLAVLFFAIRLPSRAAFLVNWDAVNFALGVEAFDLEHHQPHPPGYLGYVLLARAVRWVTGTGTETALALISVAGGAIAPAVLYVLAARMSSRRAALGVALLFGTAPLVWYYGTVALSYMAGGAIAICVAWAAHVARREASARHLYAAVVFLAVLGALRQTDLLLLAPVVAYAAAALPGRIRLRALVLLVVTSATWVLPLLWSVGGPIGYLAVSADLAELAGSRTSIVSGGLSGVTRNLLMFTLGMCLGLSALGAVWWLARRRGIGLLAGLDRTDRTFLAVWVLPATFTFLFVHTGQLGYVLLVVPAVYVVVASVLDQIFAGGGAGAAGGTARAGARTDRRVGLVALATVLALVNASLFFLAPGYAVSLVRAQQPSEPSEGDEHQASVLERTREFNVPLNDAYWRSVRSAAGEFDPETTVLLALPHSAGSFRHLAYYLPDHTVLGVGHDRDGEFGHLFSAHDLESDYSVDGLDRAHRILPIPDEVDDVLVLDPPIQRRLEDIGTHEEIDLVGGRSLLHVELGEHGLLVFAGEDGKVYELPPI